ncbi:MAG: hypothetical protein P8J86_09330 [Phycisphaerales bacterium]|nr:hypothetical protein [Phycisphaerales bacterium]
MTEHTPPPNPEDTKAAAQQSQSHAVRNSLLDEPPPARSNRPAKQSILFNSRRLLVLGVTIAVVLGLIVVLLDSPPEQMANEDDAVPTIEIKAPSQLTASELVHSNEELMQQMSVDLPSGGWIQIADKKGRLSQQYRTAHLNPNPKGLPMGWMAMDQPEIQIMLGRGRIVTITGNELIANAPNRALESGSIQGDVVIAMYQSQTLLSEDRPSMLVMTPDASFDNFLGELRCDGDIHLQTLSEEMVGRRLTMHMNDVDDRIQDMRIDELDYIRLAAVDALMGDSKQNKEEKPKVAKPDKPKKEKSPDRTEKSKKNKKNEKNEKNNKNKKNDKAIDDSSPAKKPVDESDEVYYIATLNDNVNIVEKRRAPQRSAHGNRLDMIFAMGSGLLGDSVATLPTQQKRDAGSGLIPLSHRGIAASLVTSLFGHQSSRVRTIVTPPSQDDTIITCEGPLIMVPLQDLSRAPQSSDETIIELIGTPVTMTDDIEGARATCATMRFTAPSNRADLLAGPGASEVYLATADLEAGGQQLWLDRESSQAGIVGQGWARSIKRVAHVPDEPLPSAITLTSDGNPDDAIVTRTEMQLTWTGGAEINFVESDADEQTNGALRAATFDGEVAVRSQDGTLDCGRLELKFNVDASGESTPEQMIASQDVKAKNQEQTLWADSVRVTFVPKDEQVIAPKKEIDDNQPESILGQDAQVDRLQADGNVQVLMSDGARAFAERLDGDARQERVVLTGPQVIIASDKLLIDRGTHVELDRDAGTARWKGPGQARMLTNALDTKADKRIDPPAINDVDETPDTTLRTRWNESMMYDSTFADGAGSLYVTGDVRIRSRPTEIELNTMTGDALTMEFENDQSETEAKTTQPATDEAANTSLGGDLFGQSDRRLARFIAKGNARIENWIWQQPDQSDNPRRYFIAGQHITYDDRSLEAEVIGDGQLYMRDLTEIDTGSISEDAPFGRKGETGIKWSQHLKMTRLPNQLWNIGITGDVQVGHVAPDGEVSTMTADLVELEVERSNARTPDKADGDLLNLGGDMEAQRLAASGSVFIVTPNREVDCHAFDYNMRTNMAVVSALPGRRVSIVTAGNPVPIKYQKLIWNMDPSNERITVYQGSGGQ